MTPLDVSELVTQGPIKPCCCTHHSPTAAAAILPPQGWPYRGGYLQKPCLDPVTTSYDDSLVNYEDNNYTAGTADIKNGLYIYIYIY